MPSTNDRVPTVYLKGRRVHNLAENDPPLRVRYDEKIGDLPTDLSHPERLHYPADSQHSGTIVNGISRIGWTAGGQSAWWSDAEIASILVQRARQFIKDTKSRPSLLFLPLQDVHAPRWPAEQFRGESGAGLRGDAIKQIDWVVGQVRATLRRLDLEGNTLLLFTSDNGPVYDDGYEDGSLENAHGHEANGPLRDGKYQSFEGGTRVPFIARWLGRIESGTTSDALFSQVDLLATLAEPTGASLPDDAGPDSTPLPEVLLGTHEKERTHLVQQGAGKLALRHGDWKHIPAGSYPEWAFTKHNESQSPIATPMPPPDQALLYNLADDPDESNNVIDQHPDVARTMSALLDTLRKRPRPSQREQSP